MESIKSLLPNRLLWAARMFKAYDAYEIIQKGGPPVHYDKDGLRVLHKTDHLKEERFRRAFEVVKNNGSLVDVHGRVHDNVEWRIYNLCWIADLMKHRGDFVECGVAKGSASRAICEYIDFNHQNFDFFLLDTYCGVPTEQLLPEEKEPLDYGKFGSYYEETKRNFAFFPRAHVIEGRIPDTLPQVTSSKIAYLHIDLNALVPEVAALEYFWDKMVPGGFIISDDYGHGGHEPQRRAWDAFAASKGLTVWTMPTAQGILIKP